MLVVVVNERAGNGRGRKAWEYIEKTLQRNGIVYAVILEACSQKAADRVAAALRNGDVDAVAVIGGDGTLHGLLPVLAGTGVPLGLIPAGSGNDTARAFGIPRKLPAALRVVLDGRTRQSDLLLVCSDNGTEQLSLTALATGLDAAVAADVNGSRYKKILNAIGAGSLTYVLGLLRMLFSFKPRRITLTIDGVPASFDRAWLVATANVPSYGGGLRICPDAKPDDGSLHVCIVHSLSALKLLTLFPTILSGSHVHKHRYVTLLRGSDVRIDTEGPPLLAYGDGEPAGLTPLKARIQPGQLLILTEEVSG